jgi:hypothetical protein
MFDVVLEEENAHALSTPLLCRWFNAHWVEKMIANGHRLVVYGKPKRSSAGVIIAHPEFEVVEDDAEISIHLKRIAPIHRATEGLSARVLRRIVWDVLEQLQDAKLEPLIPTTLDATPRVWALRQIHFPESWDALAKARRHLVLTEFFGMQVSIAAKRVEQTAQPGAVHAGSDDLMRRLHAALPFPLTRAQQRAITEIRADLAAPRPMNRLLHGDVGSGKTLVALSAMLLAVEAGYQAALMAPTQILAEQHYLNIHRLCEPLGLRVALRTADRREDTAPQPLFTAAAKLPGSTRVSRVGEGVSPSRTFDDAAALPHIRYARRNLPHFELPWATYAVTLTTHSRRCLSPTARTIVRDAILHFHGARYDVLAACVMPDHANMLIRPLPKSRGRNDEAVFWELTELRHSRKSFTAHEINRLEGLDGGVWEKESFDRYVRSDRDLEEKFRYILRNPWEAGIVGQREEYPWVWSEGDPLPNSDGEGSPSRRDAATNTRDACAPRSAAASRVQHRELPATEPQEVIGTHPLH